MASGRKLLTARYRRRSARKKAPVYNEPVSPPGGDYVPRIAKLRVTRLRTTVRARLEVESILGACGNGDLRRSFEFTALRRKALLAILSENDSPVSAALRADAASVAGGIKDKKIQSAVKKIALDEAEDIETRLNAVSSFIHMAGKEARKEIEALLTANDLHVRQIAYLTALRSPVREHVTVAAEKFKSQRNKRIKAVVTKRIPMFQGDTTLPAR